MDDDRWDELKDSQIDIEHGQEPIVDIPILNTYLNINKVHALQLGLYFSILCSLVYYLVSPVLSILLLVDIALSSVGVSVIVNLVHLIIPNYAYVYTVRTNPWYFLTALILPFVLILYLM